MLFYIAFAYFCKWNKQIGNIPNVHLQKGGKMLEVFKQLLNAGAIGAMCLILNYVLKYIVVAIIVKHPNLSDNKVKYITQMVGSCHKTQ